MEFTFNIAGQTVSVCAQFESTRVYCTEYLCDGEPDFSIEITERDIAYEQEKCAREDALSGQLPRKRTNAYLETIALQRKVAEKLFEYDTLLFHGSVVSIDGVAYLFTATSGTGKSTHTRLWREVFGERAVMVNDDKPFLKITEKGILACGSPWNGKHGIGNNIAVPLKAICILERGEQNQIEQISAVNAVFMLLQQSNRPMDKTYMPQYMKMIEQLTNHVLFYRMACTMDPEAAKIAYEAIASK